MHFPREYCPACITFATGGVALFTLDFAKRDPKREIS